MVFQQRVQGACEGFPREVLFEFQADRLVEPVPDSRLLFLGKEPLLDWTCGNRTRLVDDAGGLVSLRFAGSQTGQARHGGVGEQVGCRQGESRLTKTMCQPDRPDGIAAYLEEVVVPADPVQSEDGLPDGGNPDFPVSLWSLGTR